MGSPADPRFGRAKFFMIYDDADGSFTAVDNTQNLQAAQGAGLQAAQNVADAGCEVLITGHIGPKAFGALKAGGIKVAVGASGTVQEAVEAFKAGKLKVADTSDVEGHWA